MNSNRDVSTHRGSAAAAQTMLVNDQEQGLDRNSLEEDRAKNRSAHHPASPKINSNCDLSTHQKQKLPANGWEKSKKAPEQRQSNNKVSKVSESRHNIGKILLPPQPQQGQSETSLDDGKITSPPSNNSASQGMNSAFAVPPRRGPATIMHDRSQGKDATRPKQTSGGVFKVSGSEQIIGSTKLAAQSQQGRCEKDSSRKEKSCHPSASDSSSQRISNNGLVPRIQGDGSTMQNKPTEINQRRGDVMNSSTTSPQSSSDTTGRRRILHKCKVENCPNKGRTCELHGPLIKTCSVPDCTKISQQGRLCHDHEAKKGNRPKALNAATSNTNNQGTAPATKTSAVSQRKATIDKKKDDDNTDRMTKKVARTAPRPSKNSQNNAKKTDTRNVVIDLTLDSPPHESPSSIDSSLVVVDAPSASNQAIKQLDEENSDRYVVPQQLPSPPASPIPLATIHNPSPPFQPKPKPFSDMRTLFFQADGNPIASGSLNPRPSCAVSFDAGFHLDGSGSCLDDALRINVSERLQTWDPYWKVVEELGTHSVRREHGITSVGTRTTSCVPAQRARPSITVHPSSCASMSIHLPNEVSRSKTSNRDSSGRPSPAGSLPWGVKWGNSSRPCTGRQRDRFQTGDRRLIVRTLPLTRTSKDTKKRADCHLWPKGTFLQLKRGANDRVLSILQRKQQSHAPLEWKGMSHPLDLTVEIANTNVPIEINLCSMEIVENSVTNNDALKGTLMGSYALQVAICEYVAPDALYDQLMGKVAGSGVTIPKISLRSARKMAKEYLSDQTVSILESDDEDSTDKRTNSSEDKSLTFSLLCPISKAAMQTPVRGRHCKHMQCFDLKNFLYANTIVTGGRWRCGACEDFVNVRDLVRCSLFQAMLDDVGGKVSGARDRVSLRSDGTWKLMDENRLRHANKRKSDGKGSTATKAKANAEVIELL